MKPITIVKPEIEEKFRSFMNSGRILLFYAPCGFGKTTTAKALLKGKQVCEISADDCGFADLILTDKNILLIDNLQFLRDAENQKKLCTVIRENPQKRFVLLSRGLPPGWLLPFQLSGLMLTVNSRELFFDRKNISDFFEAEGVRLTEMDLTHILHDSMGYPLAMSILVQCMSNGEKYDKKAVEAVTGKMFLYFEEAVYRHFPMPLRRFLLSLALFEEFGAELAKIASGDSSAGEYLAQIHKNTTMLIEDGLDNFRFWPIFRDFLLWEQRREYTDEQIRACYGRGGLYYELHENYGKALECYSKSGETAKVSELLIKSISMHPGMWHYYEMEPYFYSLPESKIRTSPALMQGMSMLCALNADYEGSEKWYSELESFAMVRNKSDEAAKEAKSRIAFLDISLPQRKAEGLVQTITSVFRAFSAREITLPSFSVTSTLPSIMNGGKDFSEWSKKDDFLYATARKPVETVLGKDGVGLPDCAITESKFEKGEDTSSRILNLVSKLSEVQVKGTPDIEFAIVGLLARSQVYSGSADAAFATVSVLRDRFEKQGLSRFFPNIDALLCRIALRTGDEVFVDGWYRDKAPRDGMRLRTMKRYRYITRAMVQLAMGDNDGALLTLAPLEGYFETCARYIDMIHLKTLTAAAKYRKGADEWTEDIQRAVDISARFGFVRPISSYGIAALPLLCETEFKCDKKFIDKLTGFTRLQAVFYPDFLKPVQQISEKLTEAETQVLRLLCADKSNAEIGEILNIKLTTVKSHISHILQKLGVSRRSEAKTAAQKMRII